MEHVACVWSVQREARRQVSRDVVCMREWTVVGAGESVWDPRSSVEARESSISLRLYVKGPCSGAAAAATAA